MRIPILPGAVLLIAGLVAGPAEAQEAASLGFSWRSPPEPDCPDGAAARAAVTAELGHDPFVSTPDPAPSGRTVDVTIHDRADTGERSATIAVRGEDGAELGRRVLRSGAATCDELFAAIVLSLSLIANDPDGALPPETAPAEEPEAGPPPPRAPAPAAVLAAPEPVTDPEAPAGPPPTRRTPVRPSPRGVLFIGPSLAAQGSVLPSTVAEVGAVAWLRWRGVPAIFAMGGYTWAATATVRGVDGASAALGLAHGTLGLCPIESDRQASLVAGLCAGVRVGAIRSEGRGIDETHDETGLYVAIPVSARADLALAGPIASSAWAELSPSVVQPDFVLRRGMEDLPVHSVPAVGWALGISIGVAFAFEDPAPAPTTR